MHANVRGKDLRPFEGDCRQPVEMDLAQPRQTREKREARVGAALGDTQPGIVVG